MKTKTGSLKKTKKAIDQLTIGIDIGDRWSHYCILSGSGERIEEGRFQTTPAGVAKQFGNMGSVRIAIENGTHSI